jgi:hypothetical protein
MSCLSVLVSGDRLRGILLLTLASYGEVIPEFQNRTNCHKQAILLIENWPVRQ